MNSPDLKKIVEELKREIEHLRGEVVELEHQLEMKEIECEAVTDNLAEIAEYVQELEVALAEAFLMDKEEKPTSH